MLKRSQTVGLIAVFVATISFSFVLAKFARDSAGKDVLGATAACSCGFRGSFLRQNGPLRFLYLLHSTTGLYQSLQQILQLQFGTPNSLPGRNGI